MYDACRRTVVTPESFKYSSSCSSLYSRGTPVILPTLLEYDAGTLLVHGIPASAVMARSLLADVRDDTFTTRLPSFVKWWASSFSCATATISVARLLGFTNQKDAIGLVALNMIGIPVA